MKQEFKSVDPSQIPQTELYKHLLAAVAPRPIALASTIDSKGNVNLSPFSYFNVFSVNPPILIFSPSRRSRDNTTKHSLQNAQDVAEVVINVVNYDIAEKMHLTSKDYEKGVNEFVKSGFTEIPSTKVKPPRVLESPVSFECSVQQIIELGQEGGAGNLIICKVEMMHINEQFLSSTGEIDVTKLDLVGRMGGDWYTRASGGALFEITKNRSVNGIGVDGLTQSIRNSNILNQNDLGKLGNATALPGQKEIEKAWSKNEVKELFLEFETERDMIKEGLHKMGKQLLNEGNIQESLATLLIVDQI